MNATTKKVNVSEEAYNAIYNAIDEVYERTQRKPKYSEVQAIYKTSNSYIQVVMTDWLEKHHEQLSKPTQTAQKPVQLDEATITALTNSFISEVQRAKEQAEQELEKERQALYEIRDEAVEEMNAQMNIADERLEEIQALTASNTEQAQKALELQSLVSSLKSELDDTKALNQRLTDNIQRIESRNNELDRELVQTRKDRDIAQTEAMRSQSKFEEMQSRAGRLETELNSKIEQVSEREKTISTMTQQSIVDKQEIATLKGKLSSIQQRSNNPN